MRQSSKLYELQRQCEEMKLEISALYKEKLEKEYVYKEELIQTKIAGEKLNAVRKELEFAKQDMLSEQQRLDEIRAEADLVWEKYQETKQSCEKRISELRVEVSKNSKLMRENYEKSRRLKYEDGREDPKKELTSNWSSLREKLAQAKKYSRAGKLYECNVNDLNRQIQRTLQEIVDAEVSAKERAPEVDDFEYGLKMKLVKALQLEFETADADFQKKKQKQLEVKSEYMSSEKQCQALNLEYQELKKEIRERRQAERMAIRQDALEKSGLDPEIWEEAQVVQHSDGSTQIYYGENESDEGLSHGHIVLSTEGKVTYARKPSEKHGRHNFVN